MTYINDDNDDTQDELERLRAENAALKQQGRAPTRAEEFQAANSEYAQKIQALAPNLADLDDPKIASEVRRLTEQHKQQYGDYFGDQ